MKTIFKKKMILVLPIQQIRFLTGCFYILAKTKIYVSSGFLQTQGTKFPFIGQEESQIVTQGQDSGLLPAAWLTVLSRSWLFQEGDLLLLLLQMTVRIHGRTVHSVTLQPVLQTCSEHKSHTTASKWDHVLELSPTGDSGMFFNALTLSKVWEPWYLFQHVMILSQVITSLVSSFSLFDIWVVFLVLLGSLCLGASCPLWGGILSHQFIKLQTY